MEVYVCTREPSHRELAASLGAAWVGDLHDPMPRRTEGTILFAPAGELVPVALRNLARGGTLALAGMDRRVTRILSLMRLDLVFPIFATVDEAVKAEVAGT
jgi:propanol-preferring alcohol dehydrogenase